MAVVTLRISEQLLCGILRLDLDAQIINAGLDASGIGLVFTLDTHDLPEGVVEIEPHYSRSPGPDPVHLTGISYQYTDGHWAHPEPIA
jgi:hypothetical protein